MVNECKLFKARRISVLYFGIGDNLYERIGSVMHFLCMVHISQSPNFKSVDLVTSIIWPN